MKNADVKKFSKISQRKAKIEESKDDSAAAKAPVEVVDEGPKKYKLVVNKKGDRTTYPKKGDKVPHG